MFNDQLITVQIELGYRTPDGRWGASTAEFTLAPNPVPVPCLSLVLDRVDTGAASVSYRIRPEYDPRIDPTGGIFINQRSTSNKRALLRYTFHS